jgi:hypothetical protein
MADLSKFSLEELTAMRDRRRAKQGSPTPSGGLQSMSDEQLMQMRGSAQAAPSNEPAFSGSFLPFSRAQDGSVSFDSNAGIIGAIKRALTLPGDVAAGKVDPMSDESIGRAFELGTIVTPLNPAVRAGERAIAGSLRARMRPEPTPPKGDVLKQVGSDGYDAVRDMGVDYSGQAVGTMARQIKSSLESDGLLAEVAPKTFSILNKLTAPPDGSIISIASLDAARKALRNARKDFLNEPDREAARRVIEGMDDFVSRGDPGSVVAGPAAAAGKALAEARGNYAAGKRSQNITGIGESADLRAAVANSGQNLDNAIRSRVAGVLDSPKKRLGYSEAELRALGETARGTTGRNATRYVGNLLGGGGGLGAAVTGGLGAGAGAVAGGAPGAVAGGILAAMTGAGAKQLGNALTKRSLRKADELVRKRSPMYRKMLEETPLETVSPETRAALVKSLLLSLPDLSKTERALIRRSESE